VPAHAHAGDDDGGDGRTVVVSNNNAVVIGKAHDVEIRLALSFFHRYRHRRLTTTGNQ